jgi:ribosome-binding factor A
MKPSQSPRQQRIAEEIRRRLSQLVREELDHPNAWQVSLKDIELAKDFARARVWVDFVGDEPEGLMAELQQAAGRLRGRIGRAMRIRRSPELIFVHDTSGERGARLSALIEEAVRRDRGNTSDDDEGQS